MKNSKYKSAGKLGFTLLEVMIAMGVLAFMSLAIYRTTKKSFELRSYLSAETDFFGAIRLSIGILERDLQLMFDPAMVMPPLIVPTPPQGQQPPSGGPPPELAMDPNPVPEEVPSEFWGRSADPKRGLAIYHMRFLGKENAMSFISGSHSRIYKDATESEFAKITYDLRAETDEEKEQNRTEGDTQVLIKHINTDVFNLEDDDAEERTRTYRLLTGITRYSYRYYDKDSDRWDKTWDSDSREPGTALYPDMIELSLEIIGPERHSYEGKFTFRMEVPNLGTPGTF